MNIYYGSFNDTSICKDNRTIFISSSSCLMLDHRLGMELNCLLLTNGRQLPWTWSIIPFIQVIMIDKKTIFIYLIMIWFSLFPCSIWANFWFEEPIPHPYSSVCKGITSNPCSIPFKANFRRFCNSNNNMDKGYYKIYISYDTK